MYFKGRSKLSIQHEQESYYSEGAYPDPLKMNEKKKNGDIRIPILFSKQCSLSSDVHSFFFSRFTF